MKDMDRIRKEIDKLIKEDFNITYYMEDFLEGYKIANDIEDELTEEQMNDFLEKVREPGFLKSFRNTVIADINERITYLF